MGNESERDLQVIRYVLITGKTKHENSRHYVWRWSHLLKHLDWNVTDTEAWTSSDVRISHQKYLAMKKALLLLLVLATSTQVEAKYKIICPVGSVAMGWYCQKTPEQLAKERWARKHCYYLSEKEDENGSCVRMTDEEVRLQRQMFDRLSEETQDRIMERDGQEMMDRESDAKGENGDGDACTDINHC